MIFDPAESNEPIFGTFRGPLISEVLLLIELSHSGRVWRFIEPNLLFGHIRSIRPTFVDIG